MVDVREALRYAGVAQPDAAALEQMQQIAAGVERRFSPRFVLREYAVRHADGQATLDGSGVVLKGRMACTMLAECDRAALLVCTLGTGFDAMLRTLRHKDMAAYVLTDACGSAYVEAGCNAAEEELRQAHPELYLTDRFSPGYGDLPLNVQSSLLTAADAGRRLGVYVTDADLMNPSKSVTAIIGLSSAPQRARIRGCAFCTMRSACMYRERGETCGI